jgi:hypothetical protein
MDQNPVPLRSFSDEDAGFWMSIPIDATADEAMLEDVDDEILHWTVNIIFSGGSVEVSHITPDRRTAKKYAVANNYFSENWEEMTKVIKKYGGQMFSGSATRIAGYDAARMTYLLPNGEINNQFSIWISPSDQFEIYFSAPQDRPIAEEVIQAMLATFKVDS